MTVKTTTELVDAFEHFLDHWNTLNKMGWYHAMIAEGQNPYVQEETKVSTTTDLPSVLFHMGPKALWDQAVQETKAYFPPSFEASGRVTRCTINPDHLLTIANLAYKEQEGDWICLQLDPKALLEQMGIHTSVEPCEQPTELSNSCRRLHGGISTNVKGIVTEIYPMRRENDGTFVAIEGLTTSSNCGCTSGKTEEADGHEVRKVTVDLEKDGPSNKQASVPKEANANEEQASSSEDKSVPEPQESKSRIDTLIEKQIKRMQQQNGASERPAGKFQQAQSNKEEANLSLGKEESGHEQEASKTSSDYTGKHTQQQLESTIEKKVNTGNETDQITNDAFIRLEQEWKDYVQANAPKCRLVNEPIRVGSSTDYFTDSLDALPIADASERKESAKGGKKKRDGVRGARRRILSLFKRK